MMVGSVILTDRAVGLSDEHGRLRISAPTKVAKNQIGSVYGSSDCIDRRFGE
jgi:hypothetical protein